MFSDLIPVIILALKYKTRHQSIKQAINKLGGLKYIAELKPYLFDFSRKTPLNGYHK